MRHGTHFYIPEGPADMERLWHQGRELDPTKLPSWLSAETASYYRLARDMSIEKRGVENGSTLLEEIEQLESVGLIVDRDRARTDSVYVSSPIYTQIWSIGIYAGDSPLSLAPAVDAKNPVLAREDVTDVPAIFVADPFMIKADRWYMFFEVMNWRSNKGEIGLASSDDGLKWDYQQIVLDEPFHLSYPYVFEWSGDYYMIPESYQAGAVRLYKALEFPTQWSFIKNILEGPYFVDSSVFRHGDRWWLYTETSPDARHDTLRLYYAESLTGPWLEHPMSPVIEGDSTSARPAGRISVRDGRIIRFAQNCYPSYGAQVRAFEVTELTPEVYGEHEVKQSPILTPGGTGWNARGMHHVDVHLNEDGHWVSCADGW